jgi:hypothetical protein
LHTAINPSTGTGVTPVADQSADTTNAAVSKTASYTGTPTGYTFSNWTSSNSAYTCPNVTFAKGAAVSLTCTANFTAIPANNAPVINLISPANAATFNSPATVNLSARISDSDNDQVDMRIIYQKAGDSTWTVPASCNTGTLHNQAWTRTCATSSLSDGTYYWTAQGFDAHGLAAAVPAVRNFTVVTPPPPPPPTSLSCSVQPTGGQAPLVVLVNYTVTNPNGNNVTINMGDGNTLTKPSTSTSFYYTYQTASTTPYNVTFNLPGATPGTCSAQANVTNPNGGSGGEVTP